MKGYEAIFILRTDLTKDKLEKMLMQIQEAITKQNGSIDSVKDMGKLALAYPIKKVKEGLYYLLNFHATTESIDKMKRVFTLNDAIIRFMITTI